MSEQQSSGWGGFQPPASSAGDQFMGFSQGKNKFRIADKKPMQGWVAWSETEEGPRPVRFDHEPTNDELALNNIRKNEKGRYQVKFFLATVVYNYEAKKLQCFEITQKGIQNSIYNLIQMEEYGEPDGYDIIVTRTGEGLNTEYTVVGMPPVPMADEIAQLVVNTEYDLSKLFSGEYPFDV